MKKFAVLVLLLISLGCHKTVTAPVPGSVDALDAYAFRVVSDAQAALTSVKTWEQCSEKAFPPTVNIDGTDQKCDPSSGTFPAGGKEYLNTAIKAYNIAQSAGQAYHSGASKDGSGLTVALNQLSTAVGTMLSKTGGGK